MFHIDCSAKLGPGRLWCHSKNVSWNDHHPGASASQACHCHLPNPPSPEFHDHKALMSNGWVGAAAKFPWKWIPRVVEFVWLNNRWWYSQMIELHWKIEKSSQWHSQIILPYRSFFFFFGIGVEILVTLCLEVGRCVISLCYELIWLASFNYIPNSTSDI